MLTSTSIEVHWDDPNVDYSFEFNAETVQRKKLYLIKFVFSYFISKYFLGRFKLKKSYLLFFLNCRFYCFQQYCLCSENKKREKNHMLTYRVIS